MAKALTPKGIDALKPHTDKQIEVPDPGLSGLYLVVQPSGAKSWAVRYRFAGKPAKLTLGRWPVMAAAFCCSFLPRYPPALAGPSIC